MRFVPQCGVSPVIEAAPFVLLFWLVVIAVMMTVLAGVVSLIGSWVVNRHG